MLNYKLLPATHFLPPVGDLQKDQVIAKGVFLQECVFSASQFCSQNIHRGIESARFLWYLIPYEERTVLQEGTLSSIIGNEHPFPNPTSRREMENRACFALVSLPWLHWIYARHRFLFATGSMGRVSCIRPKLLVGKRRTIF